jgi:hypothetical protein
MVTATLVIWSTLFFIEFALVYVVATELQSPAEAAAMAFWDVEHPLSPPSVRNAPRTVSVAVAEMRFNQWVVLCMAAAVMAAIVPALVVMCLWRRVLVVKNLGIYDLGERRQHVRDKNAALYGANTPQEPIIYSFDSIAGIPVLQADPLKHNSKRDLRALAKSQRKERDRSEAESKSRRAEELRTMVAPPADARVAMPTDAPPPSFAPHSSSRTPQPSLPPLSPTSDRVSAYVSPPMPTFALAPGSAGTVRTTRAGSIPSSGIPQHGGPSPGKPPRVSANVRAMALKAASHARSKSASAVSGLPKGFSSPGVAPLDAQQFPEGSDVIRSTRNPSRTKRSSLS